MKIRRHYIALRRAFPFIADGEAAIATTFELAEKLDCTTRNMVMILKRMVDEGWIRWESKRGRGNRSELIFLVPLDFMLLEEAKELVGRGDLQAGLDTLQSTDGAAARETFQDWLTGQFGFRSQVEGKRRTDTLRFPLPGTIASLDPANIHYFGESHLVHQLFDGLVRMDSRGSAVLPHLAHAWETDETRAEWTFYLRKGVLFHHGREMTAADAAYSIERLRLCAPEGLYSWAYRDIASIETPDDTTIRFKLKERNELFLPFLTTNRASIVPQDVCEAEGERFGRAALGGTTIGTGPFLLASSDQGILTLEANPSYFQGRAFLDRVEVWTMPLPVDQPYQDSRELRQYQVMHNVRMVEGEGGQWQQVRQSGTTCKFLTVNELKDGPLADPRLRKLLNLAINRSDLLRLLSGDVIEGASSFWLRASGGEKLEGNGRSPATVLEEHERLELLTKLNPATGRSGGGALTLMTIPQYAADASLVAEVLKSHGIALDIKLLPAEQFKGEMRMEADLLLFAVMLDEYRELRLIDLYTSMLQHMGETEGSALIGLLRAIMAESDPGTRAKLFIRIEQELTRRHSLFFLYRKHLKTAFHPSVRGITLESLSWVRFKDLWFR
ncbi:ABC transporter substrate-binding protein [Paenibacillus sp. LHD-117]|uniref:ABC transporter substrate-binding protein n=1 Tax=Paenibacillus sp. LHD-117 TaxID=3071412 RepID=UPI0027E19133|nr:ABC transporter substrate-binding protein [Paenibacillus sp. LHD-117]MDQ6419706.1 ABC transporter substrate-binding protein [Paenibacillus sp. LHD-117]